MASLGVAVGVLLAITLGGAQEAAAQGATPQAPADARALLGWHLEQDAPVADAAGAAWRAYVYLSAGADGEARAAAATLDSLQPGSADAARFRVEADTRSPATRDAALRGAEAWLARPGAADEPAVERMRVLTEFLAADHERRARIARADTRAGWLPAGALLLVGLLAYGVRRATERGWL